MRTVVHDLAPRSILLSVKCAALAKGNGWKTGFTTTVASTAAIFALRHCRGIAMTNFVRSVAAINSHFRAARAKFPKRIRIAGIGGKSTAARRTRRIKGRKTIGTHAPGRR